MLYDLHFANLYLLYILVPAFFCVFIYKWYWWKPITYQFTLVSYATKLGGVSYNYQKTIINALYICFLLNLGFLVLKPQLEDQRSKLPVEGIDIMLALDLSGSMNLFDDLVDRRSRIQVAKEEAIKFVKKRDDDSVGLVVFGRNAISRIPLTLDKKILTEVIGDLDLGNTVDPQGTVIYKALTMALNRIKESTSKSKIIILLTDGISSAGLDIHPHVPVDIAKKLGVKIYTVGIGDERGGYEQTMWGLQRSGSQIDSAALKSIAQQTGGKFFRAKNQKEMNTIYSTIDKLEKTKKETDMYSIYHDYYRPFLWLALCLILIVTVFKVAIWRVVS